MKTRYRRAARVGLTSNLQSLEDNKGYGGDYEDHLSSENTILMAKIGSLVSTIGMGVCIFCKLNCLQ